MSVRTTLDDSILETIREVIGGDADSESFDVDLILHINTVFNYLHQLGIGPDEGFSIVDGSETWGDFIDEERFNMCKDYVFMRTKLIFDPPTSSYHTSALKEEMRELEWRLTEEREDIWE